ncbi:mechanosensitive ion channel domain-containing protein [Acidihalobacter prosperus]|uniref:DUF3772 domain-containing protein n=1 Tax=Acidihalobacter prosperus TaxID=160660 RepID=A0A1A6C596_9GAMM|nr:mechanosensitive ion channel domain-containing protein [Acidihalobacter prosperus]OBS09733.1 hypothetical protein Thpro_020783 [Acidihalobacter prosperus]
MSLIKLIKRAAILACASLMLASGTAGAKPENFDAGGLRQAQQSISDIEKALKQDIADVTQLQQWLAEVDGDRQLAQSCVQSQETKAKALKSEVDALGPLIKGESWQITSKRYALEREQAQTAQNLANCRLLLVNSNALYKTLQTRRSEQLASQLMIRGRGTLSLMAAFAASPPPYADWVHWPDLRDHLGQLSPLDSGLLALMSAFGLIAGLLGRRRLQSRLRPVDAARDRGRAIALALVVSLNRYRPGLAITGMWSLFWLIAGQQDDQWPLLAALSYVLFVYHLALVLIRGMLDPPPPATHHLHFAPELSHHFARILRWLTFNALIGLILFATPLTGAMNESVILLARSLWGTLFVANLIATIWLIRRLRDKSGIGPIRLAFALALVAGLVAEWAGYRNLSQFIVGGVVYTLIVLLLTWLLVTLVNDLFNSLEEGRHPWEQRLRSRLALREDGFIPGLFWLRMLLNTAVWGIAAFALLRIWGLSVAGQTLLLHYLTHGFTLGKISIVPSRIAVALLVLALLLSLGSWARSALDQRLSHARMERGAREAAVAITGYLAAIAAGLIALSVAGFNFQNLALIAGALSVGIGFGLQNIVNNFVSGLILLFERPIRTGDWITVGQIEGHVRRISIRSTQIQTFDRADVVVPNSDLISGPVTNWMLRDTFGRVRVPVGVAYGTDTQLVKETLLALAHEHPQVIFDDSAIPNPYVLFMSFGDSSLNFELRVYIRDVSNRLSVLSDLNFAIDAAFRKAGIAIPFPQRDIHIIRTPQDTAVVDADDNVRPMPQSPAAEPPAPPTPSGQTPPG